MADGFVFNVLTGKAQIDKDPDAELDYTWDWTDWLAEAEDTISSYTVTAVSGGIVVESHSRIDGAITAVLSGGTLNANAQVRCRIETAGGRIEDRTFVLRIWQR